MKKKLKRFFALRRNADGGFTLVELIVVIAILAILAGVAVPAYNGYIKKANQAADETLLASLNTAYTAACMENGEFNMRSLSFSPVATLDEGAVTMNKYDDSFQRFFGNGVFKYYGGLFFNEAEGVFVGVVLDALKQALKEAWKNSSFNKDGMAQELLEVYDKIGGYFRGMEGTLNVQSLMSNISAELADALGLTGMAEGINKALAAEKIEQYLMASVEGYADWDEDQRAKWKAENAETLDIVKGNAAVWGFAEDAAGRTVEEVKSSLDTFISVLGKKDDEAWIEENIDYDYVEEYYLSTLTDTQKTWYESLENDSLREQAVEQFLEEKKKLGDFEITGAEAVIYAKAAEGLNNSNTGVSGLASMYAVAAGFYNSEYAPEGGAKQPYSDFGCVLDAVNDPNFQTYYEKQGAADLQAYLDFMSYLSTNPDVDMTDPNAFSGQGGYIADALGNG